MKTYLVKLTPHEPYFFGNEKSFKFPGQLNCGQMSNQYFIKSEKMPMQTTLLGAMRYVFLQYKKRDFKYDDSMLDENGKCVGYESFRIDLKSQDFGVIKKISPLFLIKGGDKLVVTPYDHKYGEKKYTPFKDYIPINTSDKKKLFTNEFNVKDGISHSYMNVENGDIIEENEIFRQETRVGINKILDKNAFFKKAYVILNSGYSFGFYISLDDNTEVPDKTKVFLGQGKSMFTAEFIPEENDLEKKISKYLGENVVYCFGDMLAERKIYSACQFAMVETKDYRAYMTAKDGKITKGSKLYKLIKAGSIFITEDFSKFENYINHDNCKNIGFNTVVKKQED